MRLEEQYSNSLFEVSLSGIVQLRIIKPWFPLLITLSSQGNPTLRRYQYHWQLPFFWRKGGRLLYGCFILWCTAVFFIKKLSRINSRLMLPCCTRVENCELLMHMIIRRFLLLNITLNIKFWISWSGGWKWVRIVIN